MACQYTNLADVEQFRKDVQHKDFISTSLLLLETQLSYDVEDNLIPLQRGGHVIKTSLGPIQYGLPPETVKDSLNLGLEVPTYYIIPFHRFNKKFGISVAEFEFPAYFNFFVKHKQVILICSKEAEASIRIVFQETLLGPLDHKNLFQDFHPNYPKEAYPNFHKELSIFSKNPTNPDEPLQIDTLLKFIIYDENNIAQVNEHVMVINQNGYVKIIDNGIQLAELPEKVVFPEDYKRYRNQVKSEGTLKYSQKLDNPGLKEQKLQKIITWSEDGVKTVKISDLKHISCQFTPPKLAVTVLGCSHGFDPKGSTSGYIFWINGRGIMVDPPPYASFHMDQMGIPSVLISAVIISHCHADHDAGTFHKILYDTRVEVITTKTIMHSFLRKYSAISKISIDQLKSMFIFRPAIIGTTINIYGGNFKFFYSLHTIPCIGFEVEVDGKSIYFSGDTFYHPEQLQEFTNQGLISQERCNQLKKINYDCDLILHEAGVPPIHTSQNVFLELADQIKDKIKLVHVASKDVIPGLQSAKAGVENSIIIIPSTNQTDHLKRLELISKIDLFQTLSLQNIMWLLDSMHLEIYKPGEVVMTEGQVGDKFYIILNGIAKIYSFKEGSEFERYNQIGDYFGESALIQEHGIRYANVSAVTDLHLLSLERHDFWFIFGDGFEGQGPVLQKLSNLAYARQCKSIQILFKNSVFFDFTPAQKIGIETIIEPQLINDGDILWKVGDEAQFAFIVKKGCLKFIDCKEELLSPYLTSGTFIGEVTAMYENKPLTTSVKAVKNSEIFILKKDNLLAYLSKHPGLKMVFQEYKYFE